WNKALKQAGLEEYEAETIEQILQNIIQTKNVPQDLIKEIKEDKKNQRELGQIAKTVLHLSDDEGEQKLDVVKLERTIKLLELLNMIINKLDSLSSDELINAAEAVKAFCNAGLIDKEKAKEKISPCLDKLIIKLDDLDDIVCMNAAQSLKAFAEAGLIDKKKFSLYLDKLKAKLPNADSYVFITTARILKGLAEAGLIDKKETRKEISPYLDKHINNFVTLGHWEFLWVAEALNVLTKTGLIDKEGTKKKISLSLVLDKLMAELNGSNRIGNMNAAQAIKMFVEAELIDKEKTGDKIFWSLVSDKLMAEVDGSNRLGKMNAAQTIKMLVEAELIDEKETAKKISLYLDKLIVEFGDRNSAVCRDMTEALNVFVKAKLLDKEKTAEKISPYLDELIVKLNDPHSDEYLNASKAITALAEAGLVNKEKTAEKISPYLEQLIVRLDDSESAVCKDTAESLKAFTKAGLIDKEKTAERVLPYLSKFITDLDSSDKYTRRNAASVIKMFAETGWIEIDYSVGDIKELYKNKDDAQLNNVFRALIIKAYFLLNIKGKLLPKDAGYIGSLIKKTDDIDALKVILNVMVYFTYRKSPEAQDWLDKQMRNILEKSKQEGEGYISISDKEKLIIGFTSKSARQRSLMTFVVRENIEPELRVFCIRELSKTGMIDSEYLEMFYKGIEDKQMKKHLKIISDVYNQLKDEISSDFIPPVILIEMVEKGEIDIKTLKQNYKGIKKLEETKDVTVIIRGLAKDDELLLAYYCFSRPDFIYPGVVFMSFERFKKIIEDAYNNLSKVDESVINDILKDAFIKAGVSKKEAEEIAESLIKGGPPLPKNSKYLDKKGNFIPQKIELGQRMPDRIPELKKAEESFDLAKESIIKILKINFLLKSINRGLEKIVDGEKRDIKEKYDTILESLSSIGDITEVFEELIKLNNQIYTASDIVVEERLEKDVKRIIKKADKLRYSNVIMKKIKEDGTERQDFSFDNINIGLLRNAMERMVKKFNAYKKGKKLIELEERVLKKEKDPNSEEITAQDILRFMFRGIEGEANIENKGLRGIFNESLGDLVGSFGNYEVIFRDEGVDFFRGSVVVWLDYVNKWNIFESLKFSDGAQCCNSSDPKINSIYGGGIYDRNAHRWILDMPTGFFQISTESRGGEHLGWLKEWMGLDEEGLPFVGSNYIYLKSGYQVEELSGALWDKIEEIFNSIKISKLAQARPGHPATNSSRPPSDYKEEWLSFIRLQSLKDGMPIQADVKFTGNEPIEGSFFVKKLEATVSEDKLMAAFGYNIKTLIQVVLNITDAVLNPINIINLFLGEKKEGEGKREYEVEVSEKIKEMIIKNIPPEFLEQAGAKKVQVRASTREDLVSMKEMWAMAGFAKHPDKDDTLVFYIHQEYLDELKALGTDRDNMLAALARHEVWEYKLVNIYGISQNIAHLIVSSNINKDTNEWIREIKKSGFSESEIREFKKTETVKDIITKIANYKNVPTELISEIRKDRVFQWGLEWVAMDITEVREKILNTQGGEALMHIAGEGGKECVRKMLTWLCKDKRLKIIAERKIGFVDWNNVVYEAINGNALDKLLAWFGRDDRFEIVAKGKDSFKDWPRSIYRANTNKILDKILGLLGNEKVLKKISERGALDELVEFLSITAARDKEQIDEIYIKEILIRLNKKEVISDEELRLLNKELITISKTIEENIIKVEDLLAKLLMEEVTVSQTKTEIVDLPGRLPLQVKEDELSPTDKIKLQVLRKVFAKKEVTGDDINNYENIISENVKTLIEKQRKIKTPLEILKDLAKIETTAETINVVCYVYKMMYIRISLQPKDFLRGDNKKLKLKIMEILRENGLYKDKFLKDVIKYIFKMQGICYECGVMNILNDAESRQINENSIGFIINTLKEVYEDERTEDIYIKENVIKTLQRIGTYSRKEFADITISKVLDEIGVSDKITKILEDLNKTEESSFLKLKIIRSLIKMGQIEKDEALSRLKDLFNKIHHDLFDGKDINKSEYSCMLAEIVYICDNEILHISQGKGLHYWLYNTLKLSILRYIPTLKEANELLSIQETGNEPIEVDIQYPNRDKKLKDYVRGIMTIFEEELLSKKNRLTEEELTEIYTIIGGQAGFKDKSVLILDEEEETDLYNIYNDFSVGIYALEELKTKLFLYGTLAHEYVHNILHTKFNFFTKEGEDSAAIHELIADLGESAFFHKKLSKEDAITAIKRETKELKYGILWRQYESENKSTFIVNKRDEHKVPKAQFFWILKGLREIGGEDIGDVDFSKLFNNALEIIDKTPKTDYDNLTLKEFTERLIKRYYDIEVTDEAITVEKAEQGVTVLTYREIKNLIRKIIDSKYSAGGDNQQKLKEMTEVQDKILTIRGGEVLMYIAGEGGDGCFEKMITWFSVGNRLKIIAERKIGFMDWNNVIYEAINGNVLDKVLDLFGKDDKLEIVAKDKDGFNDWSRSIYKANRNKTLDEIISLLENERIFNQISERGILGELVDLLNIAAGEDGKIDENAIRAILIKLGLEIKEEELSLSGFSVFARNFKTLMQVVLKITDAVLNPINIINMFLGEKKEGEEKREYEFDVLKEVSDEIIKKIPEEFLVRTGIKEVQVRGTTREDLVNTEKMWAMAGLAKHPDK
ncbi:hypothetical protein KAU39_03275, partial [bacterium]|nr:hypothetical protein [bacterium]